MRASFLTCFIFLCKLLTCISIFLSSNTHHWIRSFDGEVYQGLKLVCYDYGHLCYEKSNIKKLLWFFYIIVLLSLFLESLNMFLLFKRKRSCINLVLEEFSILATTIFLLVGVVITIVGFIVIRTDPNDRFDWSFYIFILSIGLTFIDLLCSLVRVVSYCRENSFRSSVITYRSNNNNNTETETVYIQP